MESLMTNHAYVAHHIAGRIRIKLPYAKGIPTFLQRLRQSLMPLPGVREVEANTLTGSIIIHYDPALYEVINSRLAEFGRQAQMFALTHPTNLPEISKSAAEAEYLSELSKAGRGVLNLAKQLSDRVNEATEGAVDLREIFPFTVAFSAIFIIDWTVGAPLWLTMMFFSWSAFVDLHYAEPSQYMVGALQSLRDEIAALHTDVRALTDSRQGKRTDVHTGNNKGV